MYLIPDQEHWIDSIVGLRVRVKIDRDDHAEKNRIGIYHPDPQQWLLAFITYARLCSATGDSFPTVEASGMNIGEYWRDWSY